MLEIERERERGGGGRLLPLEKSAILRSRGGLRRARREEKEDDVPPRIKKMTLVRLRSLVKSIHFKSQE